MPTVTFLLKHYSNKKRNFSSYVNVSLAMFLKRFLRFRYFEPHVSQTFVSLKKKKRVLENKIGIRQLPFIDNKNISLGMLNKSGVHLNEYGITRLFNKLCFSMNA